MHPFELSINEAAEYLEKGSLSSVELTKSCLKRIEEIDNRLNAFITVDEEGALRQAKNADEKRKKNKVSPLCGIPLSIKDLLSMKDLRMTCGSKILEHYIAPYDATVIESLKKQDAVFVGKTTMDEFAMGSTSESCAFGVPKNPWKTGYVAGGSSGGSAVSVASGQCLGSLGSDTGGSIRQPASLCGVVGLKPTYGRVSRFGLTAFASSLDQVGPFARNVEDCALLLQAISGHDPRDSTSVKKAVPEYSACLKEGVSGLTIGIPKEYFSDAIDHEVAGIVRRGISVLEERGAKVVEISLPHNQYCVAVYYIIAPCEASSNLARYDGVHFGFRAKDSGDLLDMYKRTRSEGFGMEVKRRILIGTYALSSGYYDAYYKKAQSVRQLIKKDFDKAFDQVDVILTPTSPIPAFKFGEKISDPLRMYLADLYTIPASLAGVPGLSIPTGKTQSNLPISLQIIGRWFDEKTILRVGYNYEQNKN